MTVVFVWEKECFPEGFGCFTRRLRCSGDKAVPESKLRLLLTSHFLKTTVLRGHNLVKNNFPVKHEHFLRGRKDQRAHGILGMDRAEGKVQLRIANPRTV